MFPQKTSYDQAMRYLLTRYVALFYWLAGLSHLAYEFIEWLQTTVSIPGQKERIIDAVARIHDHSNNGIPTALLCESQTEPDFDIAARFMMGGAMLSLSLKPNRQVGDRYQLAALVINLTGNPNSARSTRLQGRNLAEWTLEPIEVNLATFAAAEVLQGIAKGEVPNVVLALIPLMKNGNDEATMQEWLRLANAEADHQVRGDFSLAQAFATLVGQREKWQTLLKEFLMIEAPFVTEWKNEGRKEGILEGRKEGVFTGRVDAQVNTLLRLLQKRGTVPADLEQKIRECADLAKLSAWLDLVFDLPSIEQFRQHSGL